jgi:DNA polymerase V
MHCDANSFYASCERLFRPDLKGKPIVVLTNNDGILIALTQEAKDIGYKRGDVYFKVKEKLEKDGVAVFSSNYTLYSDISARINVIYNRLAPDTEMYSIDESFLYFPDWKNTNYTQIGFTIRNAVKQEIGVDISVGIAPSKTLAKMCNKLAKKRGGVCEWNTLEQDKELAAYDVGDIWGIGYKKAELLKSQGVKTALDLKNYPLDKAKKYLSIVGFRTIQEINGIQAIDKTVRGAHQNIIVSRSFSAAVHYIEEIITPLAEYTQEAVKRMREDRQACKYVSVYVMTNPYSAGKQYSNYASGELKKPTSYLPEINGLAVDLLNRIFRNGYDYRKVLISLSGFTPDTDTQLDLFEDNGKKQKNENIMLAFDKINTRYGRGTLRLGTADITNNIKYDYETVPWEMKREMLSPAYTTSLSDLPEVG